MKTKIVTAASTRSLRLGDVKRHLRLTTDYTEEDEYLTSLIYAAEDRVEGITNRRLIRQRWYYYLDGFPASDSIEIPYAPLTSAPSSAITYKLSDGTSTTLSSSAWEVDTASDPGRIVLGYSEDWPSDTLWPTNPIRIEFECGYGEKSTQIPEAIKHAELLILGGHYENREDVSVGYAGQAAVKIPGAANALLAKYRNFSF